MYDENKYLDAAEEKRRLDNARSAYHAKAFELIAGFIRKHAPKGTLTVEDAFESGPLENDVTVMQVDPGRDFLCVYGEPLWTISIKRCQKGNVSTERIMLNDKGADLFDTWNQCLVPEILKAIETIDRDIDAGRARISDVPFPGTVEYL